MWVLLTGASGFIGAHVHRGLVAAGHDVVPVDLEIPGCPPAPEAIVAALRNLAGS